MADSCEGAMSRSKVLSSKPSEPRSTSERREFTLRANGCYHDLMHRGARVGHTPQVQRSCELKCHVVSDPGFAQEDVHLPGASKAATGKQTAGLVGIAASCNMH